MLRKLTTPLSFVYFIASYFSCMVFSLGGLVFGILCIPPIFYWLYLLITRVPFLFLYVVSVFVIYWTFAFSPLIFGILLIPPALYWAYLMITRRPLLLMFLSPFIAFVIWSNSVSLMLFVSLYSEIFRNNYHEIALTQDSKITIDVNHSLPFEWNYAVWVRLELIDGEEKLFPPRAPDEKFIVNHDASSEFDNIVGSSGTPKYPIKFKVRGYKIMGKEKILFYDATLNNNDSSSTFGGRPIDEKNYAKKSIYGDIYNVSKGKYAFEITNLSKNQQYFNELKAYIKISPNAVIR